MVQRNNKALLKIKSGLMLRFMNRSEYLYHKRYNIYSRITREKAGYAILHTGHALEKGMTSASPRRFGEAKVREIADSLAFYRKNNLEKDFAFNFAISILKEYCEFYERRGWQNEKEYLIAKNAIKNDEAILPVGVMMIHKKDFIKDANIDYMKFLSSRHSVRSFSDKKISSEDMKKCVEMAIKSPSACNRQMIKTYFVRSNNVKDRIIKYSGGMTNFDIKSSNMVVITYDISSLRRLEINQGLFNAGLFAMNLVNAMHSMGIGSCMLEYSTRSSKEEEEKAILNIPKNERIAIVIAAGYYLDETVVPCSVRKPLDEVYRER